MNNADDTGQLSPLHQALFALRKMREKVDTLERASHEPIAIIGMGCRFPGGADNPERFWELLQSGQDAVTSIPKERFDIERYYDPDYEKSGTISTRFGAFLKNPVDQFDPDFFGISPKEASSLDPQQRLLLEVSWEALEYAGISPEHLKGSATGVYVGLMTDDYREVKRDGFADLPDDPYLATGNGPCFAAGRISYVLGLTGPSLVVETACSSSLVCLHLASLALHSRECDLALAGGVNLMLSPLFFMSISRLGALAPDGRSKAFDAKANGFGRGEGCGMVVLKRLSDAERDGDSILAVLRGSAVNHDGYSSGLTVPNPVAQEQVIRAALKQARLDPVEVSLIETHGTGTLLGDPLEVKALRAVFAANRTSQTPLILSSVKTNIGHLEGAAGIASLIKVLLAMRHGVIPPHLHLNEINPHIQLEGFPIRIPTTAQAWEPASGVRIAGISSFGMSGTNAHIIVAEAPQAKQPLASTSRPGLILPLSAATPTALYQRLEQLDTFLATQPDAAWPDIAHTLSCGRKHLTWRLGLIGANITEIRAKLADMLARRPEPRQARRELRPGLVLPDFARLNWNAVAEFTRTQPAFRQELAGLLSQLNGIWAQSPLDLLESGQPAQQALLDSWLYAGPVWFALHYRLARLWQSWGIIPAVLAGMGLGELVAAALANIFRPEDIMTTLARLGQNATIPAAASVAIDWTEASRRELLANLAHLPSSPAGLDILFPRVGAVIPAGTPIAPDFWHSLLRPVNDPAVSRAGLANQANRLWIPIQLADSGPEIWQAQAGSNDTLASFLPPAEPGQGVWHRLLSTLAAAYEAGLTIDWQAFDQPYGYTRRVVPTYPFQRRRCWYNSVQTGSATPEPEPAPRRTTTAANPLLGQRLTSPALRDIIFENEVDIREPGGSQHHRIQGLAVFPASAFLEIAAAALKAGLNRDSLSLKSVRFAEPLVLTPTELRTMQVIITGEGEAAQVTIYSRNQAESASNDRWTLHFQGHIVQPAAGDLVALPTIQPPTDWPEMAGAELYARLARNGFTFGGDYEAIVQCWLSGGVGWAKLKGGESAKLPLSAVLMAGFQALSLGLAGTTSDGPTGEFAHLPAGVDAIQLRSSQQSASWIKTELHQSSAGGLLGHISVYADDGTFLAELFDVKLNRVSIHSLRQLWQRDWTEYCYDLDWQEYPVEAAPLDPADPALTGQHWLIFADQAGWASALARRLTSLGATLTLVRPAASFGRDESGCYTLRPDQAEDFRKLADRIETERQGRPLRIVYAWAMDLPPNIQNESELQLAERLTGLAMLHLVQTWLIGPPGMVQALWLHTRGSQVGHLPDQAVAFGQAPLWGMGRGIALEFPEISSGLIDWQPNAELEAEVTAFLTLVKKRPSEDQLVRRDSGWLVPRLRSVRPDLAPSTLPIDPQASYLIPGGLGHIGWQLARWLASQGARHLILTGRRSWDAMLAAQPSKRAEREQERAELGRQGCHIECVQVDLADRKGMTELIASIRQSGHPLRGIIHVAADLQGEPLANMSPAALQGMFRPKVHGTWLLHDITRGLELDFFVLFSSIISLIGSHGLAHYAAANQFIDALAHQRRGLHLPALAVNWGTWQGTSLPIAGGSQKYHDFGFREIPFGQGLLGLGRLIGQKYAQLTVADIDWNILKPAYETKRERPLLTGLAVATAPAAGQMLAQLRALPLEARWKALIEFMKAEVRAVLGHDASRPIDPKAGFFEMGMDSLLGLKFKKRLESELSISLPATIIFSAPDIQALATHLAETGLGVEIRAGSAGAAPEIKAATIPAVAPAAAIEASPGDIEALSDDEVAQSLEQELQRRGY